MATFGLRNRGSKTLDNIIGSQQICSDKSGISFGGKKEQKQSASTSHDTRTQGKGVQNIQHKGGLLKLPRVGNVKEKKVHPVFICHHCGVHCHIRPYCYKLYGRVYLPRPKNRKLEAKSRQVPIAGKRNHNVKTPPKNCNSRNFVHTKVVWVRKLDLC